MDKEEIKKRVIRAYRYSVQYPDFMSRFKPAVQEIIDSLLPGDATHYWHVEKDIEYLSALSKREGYKTDNYLRLIADYIFKLVMSYDEGKKTIDFSNQEDLFNKEDIKPKNPYNRD